MGNVEPITIIAALLSVSVGGILALLGVYLTNRSNTQRLKIQMEHEALQQRGAMLRARGEELYELADEWLGRFASEYLSLIYVMQERLSYNQHLDSLIAEGKKAETNMGRLEMLVEVYFPSTKSSYQELLKARDSLADLRNAHTREYKSGITDGRKFLKPFKECQMNLQKAGDAFKAQVMECIRLIP